MDFPKDRLEFTNTHGGDDSENGWLVLNINGLDLEGVHKLYIDLSELDHLRQKRNKKAEVADRARKMFTMSQSNEGD